jgi:ribonuclease T
VSHDEAAAAPILDTPPSPIAARFRGFLPVIVDVETGGFNCATDALLEVAAVFVRFDASGDLEPTAKHRYIVKPFEGSRLDPASLQVTHCGRYFRKSEKSSSRPAARARCWSATIRFSTCNS